MEDSTDPTDASITDTSEDNYSHVRGLAKEWRKRYRRAQQQREELETLLRRLEEERQMEKVQQEELEERSRLDLEEERRALDLQVETLRKGIQEVAQQNSATQRQVEEMQQALAQEFQNVVGNLQEAMAASLLEQEAQKEKAEAALKEVAENEAEVRAWEEEQEKRVAELRTEYNSMLEEMAQALQRKKAEEQERYAAVQQGAQVHCQQLRTDMKERYDRLRFELDERQGRMDAKHVKESKDLRRLTELARLRVREAEQELAMVLMRTEHAKHELSMLRRKFFPSEDPKKKKTKVPRQEVTDDLNSDLNRLVQELGMRVQEFNQIEVQIELHLAGETGAADSCTSDGDLNPEEEMARLETALDFKLREIESLQRRLRDKQIQVSYGRSDSKSRVFGSRRSGTGSGPPATSGGRSDVTWDSATSVVRLRSDESLSPWRQRSLTPLSPTTSLQREDVDVTSSPEGQSSGIGSLKAGPSSRIGSLNQSWGSSISEDRRRRLAPLRAPGSAPEVSRKETSEPEGRPRCSSSPSVRTKAEH